MEPLLRTFKPLKSLELLSLTLMISRVYPAKFASHHGAKNLAQCEKFFTLVAVFLQVLCQLLCSCVAVFLLCSYSWR
jgi:hypothetical protein